MLAHLEAQQTPPAPVHRSSFVNSDTEELFSRSYTGLRLPSTIEYLLPDEKREQQEFWNRTYSARAISNELHASILRASDDSGVSERTSAIALPQFFCELSRSEQGRQQIQNCLARSAEFQFLAGDDLLVTQQARMKDLVPLRICGEKPVTWQNFSARLATLAPEQFSLWFAHALQSSDTPLEFLKNDLRDSVKTAPFTVCTYNVWGLQGVLGIDRLLGFGIKDAARFSRIGQELKNSNFDVVTLQEMWDTRTETIITESQYPHIARGAKHKGMWQSPGLVTLSRHPIVASEFTPFTTRGGHERYVKKGVLRTRIAATDGTLRDIYNLHLISPAEKLPLIGNSERLHRLFGDAPVQEIRLQQIDEVAQLVTRRYYREQIEYLVMGDLNSLEGSHEHQRLIWQVGVDAFRARHPLYKNTPPEEAQDRLGWTYDPKTNHWAHGRNEPSGRLDYTLLSPKLAFAAAIATQLVFNAGPKLNSDHAGVATTIVQSTEKT